MLDMDDIDDSDAVPGYTFRCAGWAAPHGPCGDPDCSRCGPSVSRPADEDDEPTKDDAGGEE